MSTAPGLLATDFAVEQFLDREYPAKSVGDLRTREWVADVLHRYEATRTPSPVEAELMEDLKRGIAILETALVRARPKTEEAT